VTAISQVLWGSIGYSVGALQGAALAVKEQKAERRVILFVGDGSLQLTVQEISTMIRHDLTPIMYVYPIILADFPPLTPATASSLTMTATPSSARFTAPRPNTTTSTSGSIRSYSMFSTPTERSPSLIKSILRRRWISC